MIVNVFLCMNVLHKIDIFISAGCKKQVLLCETLFSQVFLLDNQTIASDLTIDSSLDNDKSYVFLFYSSSISAMNESPPIARLN
jgi:hypothetical protein